MLWLGPSSEVNAWDVKLRMQADQRTSFYQTRVFHYSLDWRFLLPLSSPDKIFVLCEDNPDFGQTLEQAGIPASNQLSFLDIQQRPQTEASAIVLPFGLPVQWVSRESADQIEFFRSMRKIMGEHGYFLVGFNNAWGYRPQPQTHYYSSSLPRITSQLQEAGFKTIKVFGVISNLSIPEYIFDLHPAAMSFAFQHRFKTKPLLLRVLQLLARVVGSRSVYHFLPCYFVTAAV